MLCEVYSNCFYNGSKGFTKVQTFHLKEAFGNESCLVAHHHTVLTFLVLEHPFCSNDVLAFWSFNKLPYLIPCEVVQLILHCHDPILLLQGIIHILGFYTRDKSNIFTKGCMILRASFYPLGRTPNDEITWMSKSLVDTLDLRLLWNKVRCTNILSLCYSLFSCDMSILQWKRFSIIFTIIDSSFIIWLSKQYWCSYW